MPELRIRVELNKGRIGIPLGKLAAIVEETSRFLGLISDDAGLGGDPHNWLAQNFENNSVDFDIHKNDIKSEPKRKRALTLLRGVMGASLNKAAATSLVSAATWRQYAKIAAPLDSDEKIDFGLYLNGSVKPDEAFTLTKTIADTISRAFLKTASYFGQTQGRIHALYKEVDKPKLVIRDLSEGYLLDCFYKSEHYPSVVRALADENASVIAEGIVTENLESGRIESISADVISVGPHFDLAFYNSFLGSKPDLTGRLSTEQYINLSRRHG
jgi:hypothetical protein